MLLSEGERSLPFMAKSLSVPVDWTSEFGNTSRSHMFFLPPLRVRLGRQIPSFVLGHPQVIRSRYYQGINHRAILMEESAAKKLKTFKVRVLPEFLERMKRFDLFPPQQMIGTHNGTFHCDEALAVFLLRQTATYRDAGQSCHSLHPNPS